MPEAKKPETGLMKPGDFGRELPEKYTSEDFKDVASGDWLPRLQLCVSQSDPCKNDGFPINHYALIRGKATQDLGESVDCLLLGWRTKAVELGEQTITVFDKSSEQFQRIQSMLKVKDVIIRMAGPEFLVHVNGEFATLFCGNASLRVEAPSILAKLEKWKAGDAPQPSVTLKHQKLSNKTFSWVSIKATPCSTPIAPPDSAKVNEQLEKFLNPEDSAIEAVKPEPAATEERAR